MKTLLAYIELARPLNGVIAFISAGLGGMFAGSHTLDTFTDMKLIYVCIAALLLLSAGNAINDFYDYNIDRINKPKRPLPSKRIPRLHALIFATILLTIGIGLGFLINKYAVGIAIIVSCMLVGYAVWLKRMPFIGNIVVATLTSITFISGGVAIGSVHGTIIPAIFAFLFTTAREIVKDLEDTEGDLKNDSITLAILNPRIAAIATLCFMASVIVFSPIPYLFGWYTWHYLAAIVLGVDTVLIILGFYLWKNASKATYTFVQRCMKWDIFIGLGAIYLGTIFQR